MKRDSSNLYHRQEMDMKKVNALKKAVNEGTYAVPPEDLAVKLMESLFQNTVLIETTAGASVSQATAEDHYNPQHSDAQLIPGGAKVNRKDSR